MTFDDICAVIVTRGNVDLAPIQATLECYPEVTVWNDLERGSRGCYGRYLAAELTDKPVVYFQDDDLIFTAHEQLLALYEPGRMTVNMPSPWYEIAGYDKLRQALVGAGSLVDRGLWQPAIDSYLAAYPADELFDTYCDVVVGMLTPYSRHDLGYEVLPYASAPGRIYTTAGAVDRKKTMQRRAIAIRAGLADCTEQRGLPLDDAPLDVSAPPRTEQSMNVGSRLDEWDGTSKRLTAADVSAVLVTRGDVPTSQTSLAARPLPPAIAGQRRETRCQPNAPVLPG